MHQITRETPQAKGQQWQCQVKLEDHSSPTGEYAQVSQIGIQIDRFEYIEFKFCSSVTFDKG